MPLLQHQYPSPPTRDDTPIIFFDRGHAIVAALFFHFHTFYSLITRSGASSAFSRIKTIASHQAMTHSVWWLTGRRAGVSFSVLQLANGSFWYHGISVLGLGGAKNFSPVFWQFSSLQFTSCFLTLLFSCSVPGTAVKANQGISLGSTPPWRFMWSHGMNGWVANYGRYPVLFIKFQLSARV